MDGTMAVRTAAEAVAEVGRRLLHHPAAARGARVGAGATGRQVAFAREAAMPGVRVAAARPTSVKDAAAGTRARPCRASAVPREGGGVPPPLHASCQAKAPATAHPLVVTRLPHPVVRPRPRRTGAARPDAAVVMAGAPDGAPESVARPRAGAVAAPHALASPKRGVHA